ncbi:MAG TPA: patatin-like phospholipase family protein, partial [Telluria sp.]|nr:patatin-like phospholipase family protein [Telluria sp.]
GAYQVGVYQALHEAGIEPDWVIGTSIGAINAALIAGNPQANRLQQVKAFWDRVSHPDGLDMSYVTDEQRRSNIWLNTVDVVMRGVPGFFTPRLFSGFPIGMKVPPEDASFYDTTPLCETLKELVDFDYLNGPHGMRLTVNAVDVRSGELAHFDSLDGQLCADHVRASGSLPPAFAPVRIGEQLFWDGGLYSNTPLESVLAELPKGDTLCFMVDLWSAEGAAPETMDEVQTRQKDITYASRSRRHIDDYAASHALKHKLRELYGRLPEGARTDEDRRELEAMGVDSILHIVRLPYAGHDWHMAAKDVNFSKGSIEWRWDQGYRDALRALKHAGWLSHVAEDTAVVVHELPAD